ncbi:hypothetical protein EG028_26055 [Chitinophaga barathri]|uniref:Uncharacterized protein n=1 Tax=Chitinophaga barathri TaxID=1647451 RepID=A0A3N4MSH1_9BACT|nr:hypothetical protein EG028_26055 [Chitinophaga barathri]
MLIKLRAYLINKVGLSLQTVQSKGINSKFLLKLRQIIMILPRQLPETTHQWYIFTLNSILAINNQSIMKYFI